MIPRGKLDISFSALFTALSYTMADLLGKKQQQPEDKEPELYCLSVRTGLSLTLTALNFKPNTEILIMNINIPDMFSVLSAYHLNAIPLAVNKHTLSIDLSQATALLTEKTKAILVTHLFGSILELEEISIWAKNNNLIVLEDCAQAYDGTYTGHPSSDVVMFSFGLIKSNTSLTGAMLRFKNQQLYQQVLTLNNQLPQQKPQQYLKKIFKGFLIKIVTTNAIFSLIYSFSKLTNRDFDNLLANMTKGFPGANVMTKIRFRPCHANIRLIKKRLAEFPAAGILARKQMALAVLETVPYPMKIGNDNKKHSYWVLPVASEHANALIESLRKKGCDATNKASSLIKLQHACIPTLPHELDLAHLVYLPIDQKTAVILKQLEFELNTLFCQCSEIDLQINRNVIRN